MKTLKSRSWPYKILLVLVTVIVSLTHSLAQRYTLPMLLEESAINYPAIRAKNAEAESASREASAARSEYIPRITAQHQYTYATSNSLAGAFYPNPAIISPSGGIRASNIDQATWGSYTSAIMEWNVFNFGKVSANVKAGSKGMEAAQADYENAVFQQKVLVADAYLLALMYRKLSIIQERNLERAQAFRDAAKAGVLAGMRPGVDSSLASAEYAKAVILLLQAERDENVQQLKLTELAGIRPAADMDLDSMSFLATAATRVDTLSTIARVNPLLKLYKLRTETSQLRSIAIKRSFLPSITLVGSAWARGSGISPSDDSYHTDFASGTAYQVHNYLLGVSARWTLTDFVSSHQRYKSEYYRSVRDQELYNELSLRVNRQRTESDMQFDLALQQARMAPVQLRAARDSFQQAGARYQAGLADLPTLMQSMLTLGRAEADMAISYINTWRSLLGIAAAQGEFSIFMNALQGQ